MMSMNIHLKMQLTKQGIVDISNKEYILEISGILLSQIQIGYEKYSIKYWTPIDDVFYSDDIEDWFSFIAKKNGMSTENFKTWFFGEKERFFKSVKVRVEKKKEIKEKKLEIKKETYLDKLRNNAKQ